MKKLMPLAKDKNLDYQIIGVDDNESALFEPRMLTRVLDNLVQNALRYAANQIEVTLSKNKGYYCLIIEDDGCEIDKLERKKIFEALSRIDPRRHKSTDGFCLGLVISDKSS